MSEFDYIQVSEEVNCPICNTALGDFKTKNGPGAQITLDYKEVDRFYCYCSNCHHMVGFTLKKDAEGKSKAERAIEDYDKQSKIY